MSTESTNRFSARTLRHTGTILTVLSLLGLVWLGAWSWQVNDAQDAGIRARAQRLAAVELGGKNLSTALDKQRAQFEACKDAKPGTPGCYSPVAPPAKEVAPQIVTGPIGPQGYQGLQGPKGDIGLTGINGLPGTAGTNGTGTNGTDGASGVDGAPGPAGAKGEPGPAGASGAPGAAGQSAYPFTFSFTTTAGLTYTCTLPAASERGACTETTPAPTPTP